MVEIQGLKIQGSIVTPSSSHYEQAIARISQTAVRRAAYVIYPENESDIVEILRFSRSQVSPFDVAVKCGGHNPSGAASSEGGIVIDLARIKHIKVSEDKKTVSVGGGALWGDVYTEIEKYNIRVAGASFGSVGVGGFATGGGYSILSGAYGLAIDNLVRATVVLADGRVVTCDADNEPDLFWAIRGAGSQFGIVVEFVFRAYPAEEAAQTAVLAYPGTELPAVLKTLRDFLASQKLKSKMVLSFSRGPPDYQPSIHLIFFMDGSHGEAEQQLSSFRTDLHPVFQRIETKQTMTFIALANDQTMKHGPSRILYSQALFSDLWDDMVTIVYDDWVKFTSAEERKTSFLLWEFVHPKKVSEVKVNATAFPVRTPHYYAIVAGRHSSSGDDPVAFEWVSKTVDFIQKVNVNKTGKTLPTPAYTAVPGAEKVADVYGENYAKLRKLKAKYDPGNVWNKGFVIEPDF